MNIELYDPQMQMPEMGGEMGMEMMGMGGMEMEPMHGGWGPPGGGPPVSTSPGYFPATYVAHRHPHRPSPPVFWPAPWPPPWWSWMRLHPAFSWRYMPFMPFVHPMLTTVPCPPWSGPWHTRRPSMASPVYLSGSGSVGTPGLPVRIMSLVANGGGSSGTLTLYNGRDTAGQIKAVITVPASAPLVIPIMEGWHFPQGLYVAFAGPANATFGIT